MSDLRSALTMLLLFACIALGGILLWQNSHVKEQAGRITSLERDISGAVSANRQANATIISLQRDANATSAITVGWTEWAAVISSTGKDAAIAIEGEKDAVEILDAHLPVAFEHRLDRVREQAVAASGGSSQSGDNRSAGAFSSGAENPGTADRQADAAKAGAMDSIPARSSWTERRR